MKSWIIKKIFGPVAEHADICFRFPDGSAVGTGQPVVTLLDWKDVYAMARNPSIGFAEAWGYDRIRILEGDLITLVGKLVSPAVFSGLPAATRLVIRTRQLLMRLGEGWTPAQSRRNVHHHYDLGNSLYSLFLDDDWQYSCAYFDDPSISLDEAQRRKKDHIARKLRLDGRQTVLDIGCGWGGMALHLAPRARAVTGITLSQEQLDLGRMRIRDARGNISLEMRDFRLETGRFDRIVSVGMLEHVGPANLPMFFRKVSACLEDDGIALIHTIGRVGTPGPTDPFISKYIFPGGYLPSLSQLTSAIEKTDLAVGDIETLFLHYARTLHHWRQRYMANRHRAVAMYDEFFARIWELYLASSEASFRNGNLAVYQIQLFKPKAERPFSRDYIYPQYDVAGHAHAQEYSNSQQG